MGGQSRYHDITVHVYCVPRTRSFRILPDIVVVLSEAHMSQQLEIRRPRLPLNLKLTADEFRGNKPLFCSITH